MTNREVLNAMPDEEFADWLSRAGVMRTEMVYYSDDDWDDMNDVEDLAEYQLPEIYGNGSTRLYYYDSCGQDILEWLQDEYGEDPYSD